MLISIKLGDETISKIMEPAQQSLANMPSIFTGDIDQKSFLLQNRIAGVATIREMAFIIPTLIPKINKCDRPETDLPRLF